MNGPMYIRDIVITILAYKISQNNDGGYIDESQRVE